VNAHDRDRQGGVPPQKAFHGGKPLLRVLADQSKPEKTGPAI
jgi:hypothetical protein